MSSSEEPRQLFVREANRRYRAASDKEIVGAAHGVLAARFERGEKIESPHDSKALLQMRLGMLEREVFVVLFLDNRHRVLACEDLFWGTIDGASVHPREVAKRALELNAVAVIAAHNHPSGDPEPSAADRTMSPRS